MGQEKHCVALFIVVSGLLLALLLLYAGCSGGGTLNGGSSLSKATLGKPVKPPPEPPEPGNPEIAYTTLSLTGQGDGLMVMDADGSNPFNVYETPYAFPSWSPDGTKLAFRILRVGLEETDLLCTINVDGSGYQVVSDEPDHLRGVAWSPVAVYERGYKIAYAAGPDALGMDIWLISPEGGVAENVTNTPDVFEEGPSWSPDATRLAYLAARDDGNGDDYYDIWIHDFSTDSAARVELGGPFVDRHVAIGSALDWARTQDKIAFSALTSEPVGDTAHNGFEIWVVDLNDPANPVQLTDDPSVPFWSPSWSPDDSELIYTKGDFITGSYCELWKMNADGSGQNLLLKPDKKSKTRTVAGPSWKR